jgi:hypothetical protein
MAVTIRGSGQVPVQVIQTILSSTFTSSAGSGVWADITGLSANITPTNSLNKILVTVQINVSCQNGVSGARVLRGSTPVGVGDAASNRLQASSPMSPNANNADTPMTGTVISFLDSPSTTSSTTYKVQGVAQFASTFYVNRSVADSDSTNYARYSSTITLQEIAYA